MKGRWAYAIKYDGEGNIIKRKARYVAKGFMQVYGIDYDKTYAAVAGLKSIRIIFAIIAVLKLRMWQIDFQAYLNSDIDKTVYMEQPEGFKMKDDTVCLLLKGLYGMMQAGHLWADTLDKTYATEGYSKSKADPCVRFKRENDEYTLMATYMDDVMGVSSTESGSRKAKDGLGKHWPITHSEHLNVMVGIAVHQDSQSGDITLSQSAYFQ